MASSPLGFGWCHHCMTALSPAITEYRTKLAARRLSTSPLVGWGFLEWFIVAQTLFPALLFVPGSQSFRMFLRIMPFAISGGALLWTIGEKSKIRPHPAQGYLSAAV